MHITRGELLFRWEIEGFREYEALTQQILSIL